MSLMHRIRLPLVSICIGLGTTTGSGRHGQTIDRSYRFAERISPITRAADKPCGLQGVFRLATWNVYLEGVDTAVRTEGVCGKESELDVSMSETKGEEAMGGSSRDAVAVGAFDDEIEEEETMKKAPHAQEIARYRLRRPSLWKVNDYSSDRLMVERYPYDNEE